MTTHALQTILLLMASNTFMTIAWYGHLRFKDILLLRSLGLPDIILLSWGIVLLGYALMVPANRIGSNATGGPFNIWQLKMLQETISILVFVAMALVFFRIDELRWTHIAGFLLIPGAVYLFFKR